MTGNINHLGVEKAPFKSTIAYQNEHRSPKIFRDFYDKPNEQYFVDEIKTPSEISRNEIAQIVKEAKAKASSH